MSVMQALIVGGFQPYRSVCNSWGALISPFSIKSQEI